MKLQVKPFVGQHCESTATGTLLHQLGIELSEPMLFGLGEGLDYIIWKMKFMDAPFIGGRIKPDLLTVNIARNLRLNLSVHETTSKTKAWKEVKSLLDSGKAVGIKLDCYDLEYFSQPIHFAGHYVAMYGYDETYAYLVDTVQQGTQVKTSLSSLSRARAEKGSMSSNNLYYIIEPGAERVDLAQVVAPAIRANAERFLNPPIKNLGYKGIIKTSKDMVAWYKLSTNVKHDFGLLATLMERGGTGGALFRNFYRDFLGEAHALTQSPVIQEGFEDYTAIANDWAGVIRLFNQVAQTGDEQSILEAASMLEHLAEAEHRAMQKLLNL